LEQAVTRVASTGDYDRRTPLHLAAAEGQADIVDYIVSLGKFEFRDRS